MRLDRENIRNLLVVSIGVVVLLLLTACAEMLAEVPPPPEKALTVTPTQSSHQVRFAVADTHLGEDERARLDGFIGRMDLGGPAKVYLAIAGDSPVERRRRAVVAAYLRLRGLQPEMPVPEFGIPEPDARAVRVVVRHHVVTLPACPDWTKDPGSNFGNTMHSNFGCATASNLGLMVADPGHIVHGSAPGPMDGEYATGAIDRYRRGETKPLETEGKSDTGEPQQTTNISVGGGGN